MNNQVFVMGLLLFGIVTGCVPAQSDYAPSKSISAEKGSIPFKLSKEQMVVEATVNQRVKVDFLVDTGADLTMITTSSAKELGIILHSKLPTISLQTVSDVIHVPLVVLDSVEVGGMEVKDVTAAVYDAKGFDPFLPGPRGLLGRNFLRHFHVQIDLKEGFLRLDKRCLVSGQRWAPKCSRLKCHYSRAPRCFSSSVV